MTHSQVVFVAHVVKLEKYAHWVVYMYMYGGGDGEWIIYTYMGADQGHRTKTVNLP